MRSFSATFDSGGEGGLIAITTEDFSPRVDMHRKINTFLHFFLPNLLFSLTGGYWSSIMVTRSPHLICGSTLLTAQCIQILPLQACHSKFKARRSCLRCFSHLLMAMLVTIQWFKPSCSSITFLGCSDSLLCLQVF